MNMRSANVKKFIISLLVQYFVVSYVKWDFFWVLEIPNWDPGVRFLSLFMSAFITAGLMLVITISRNEL